MSRVKEGKKAMDYDAKKKIVMNILFASGKPVDIITISKAIGEDTKNTKEFMDELIKKEEVFEIVKVGAKYQMTISKEQENNVLDLFDTRPNPKLTNAAFEVLAIIAYNPKITKAQIEKIRGVISDSVVSRLLDYGLIEESGKLDVLGKPMSYSTTDKFLLTFGLNDITELPKIDELETNE